MHILSSHSGVSGGSNGSSQFGRKHIEEHKFPMIATIFVIKAQRLPNSQRMVQGITNAQQSQPENMQSMGVYMFMKSYALNAIYINIITLCSGQ